MFGGGVGRGRGAGATAVVLAGCVAGAFSSGEPSGLRWLTNAISSRAAAVRSGRGCGGGGVAFASFSGSSGMLGATALGSCRVTPEREGATAFLPSASRRVENEGVEACGGGTSGLGADVAGRASSGGAVAASGMRATPLTTTASKSRSISASIPLQVPKNGSPT